jgi:uncharacterized lipoprotein YehR (DUF1307 family)|tara:strand:- start:5063 stop:7315 length:2253 start_codon:yes stop_codon:yes gene_type:complete
VAEVSSAYVDLGKFWTYDPKSKSKESQFYDNAWIIGDKPIEGTKSLPAAYFYVKGEKDNVGFTPTSIDYDARSGLLSVQGRQEGVDRILQRAYMMNAPAPRFMRVRASERSRRPADLVVKNIIVDMEDSMPNIKAYLGIETEEKEVEDLSQDEDFFNMKGLDYDAEEFEAPKPQLTKNQLKLLDYLKVSAFNGGGRDAYVKTDRKGYDGFKPQLVQKLIDKGIISTSEGSGRIESLKAYTVKLNPIAWKYPFRYGGDKSLKQRGNKIVRNMKIHREETARKLEEQRRRDNMTFAEVYAELFGAEEFSAEEVDCDWVQIGHGNHPTKMSYIWYCEKINAQIDSIKKPSRNRKVRPNSFTQNWRGGNQSHYFGAETYDDWMINIGDYDGHTKGDWETNSEDSQGVWQEHDESIPRTIAMVHPTQNWEDMSEAEFNRMMADKKLIADAPKILNAYQIQNDVLSTLDERIRYGDSHADLMKALEQGLGLTETWNEEFGAEGFEAEDEESYLRHRYGEPLENMSRARKIDFVADSLKDLTSLDMLFTIINNLSTKQGNQLINRLYAGIREGSIRTKPFRDNVRANRVLHLGAEEPILDDLQTHGGDYLSDEQVSMRKQLYESLKKKGKLDILVEKGKSWTDTMGDEEYEYAMKNYSDTEWMEDGLRYLTDEQVEKMMKQFGAEEDFEVVSVNVGYSIPPERREDGKWMSFGDVVFELSDGKISRISTFGSGDEKSEAREKLVERAKSYLMEEEGF